MTPQRAARLKFGDHLRHRRRREPCRFVGLDQFDPSGETAWVHFYDTDDDHVMVSVRQLEPA